VPSIDSDSNYATFINVFICEPPDQAEVVRLNVEIIERVARRAPGFLSATVHRSIDGTRVFNYLQWETTQHLADMQRSSAFREIAAGFAGLIEFEPHECDIAHIRDSN
jgi:heme-degrading monooxygenase HmoA